MNYTGQVPLSERYRLIEEELRHSNLQPNNVISKTEFFELLDNRIYGRTFDRGIAAQLYDRMNKDMNGNISIDNFIRVFIEAQDFLTQNIIQTQEHLHEYETQRLEAIDKLAELRHEEVLNAYGIMENSILTMQVLDLREVNRAAFREVFVAVTCGEHTFETEPYPYTDGMEWADPFNLEIKTGMEMLQIHVVALGGNNQTEVVGELAIPVKELGDQYFRDEYFDLLDSRGNIIGGRIHLKLQWIHSRVKYLENVIRKWEESIQIQLEDKEDFEQSLTALSELFPNIPHAIPQANQTNVYPDMRLSQGQNRPSHTNDIPKDSIFQDQQRQSGLPQGLPQAKKAVSPQRESQISQVQPQSQGFQLKEFNPLLIDWNSSGKWGHLSFFGTLLLLILAIFACFIKASFIELILCLGLLKEYDSQRKFQGTLDTMKLLLGILVIAISWSLLWLIFNTSGLTGRVVGWEANSGTFVFVLIIEYISFFLKVALLVCYFFFYKNLKDQTQNTSALGAQRP